MPLHWPFKRLTVFCFLRTLSHTIIPLCSLAHCKKNNPNVREINWNVEENLILHEIFRVVSRFPCYISCYIAKSRLPLGQCIWRTKILRLLLAIPPGLPSLGGFKLLTATRPFKHSRVIGPDHEELWQLHTAHRWDFLDSCSTYWLWRIPRLMPDSSNEGHRLYTDCHTEDIYCKL